MNKKHTTVAFIGVDGSGKSTIIKNVSLILKKQFNTNVFYEHMRPNLLPSIAFIFGKQNINLNHVNNPHASPPSSTIISFVRWLYYYFDYTFGFFVKVSIKKINKQPSIFIFDRYYYDYFIDPKRSRINLPNFILNLGQKIMPEPDIIFCLIANPELIFKRKPELPIKEIKRQIIEIEKFSIQNTNSVIIRTDQTISQSVNECLNKIINF